MQILGIWLENGDPRVIKNLIPGTWYSFGDVSNCREIFDPNGNIQNTKKYEKIVNEIEEKQSFTNKLYEVGYNAPYSVNINCILGMNGSGKSSLLNLEYRIINNFACKINFYLKDYNQGHSLKWSYGFNANLYYFNNNRIYCIQITENSFLPEKETIALVNPIENVKIFYQEDEKTTENINALFDYLNIARDNAYYKEQEYKENEKKLMELLSKHFFYTVATNYSIYSNATVYDYETGKEEKWQANIYHKNDGYLTPIVMVPYKESGATIDTKKELSLAKERVSTLAILLKLENNIDFVENLHPSYIKYRLKTIEDYEKEIKKKCIRFIDENFSDDEIIDKRYDNLKEGYNFEQLRKMLYDIWEFKLTNEQNKYHISWNEKDIQEDEVKKTIKTNLIKYLSCKVIKMCLKYDIYKKEFLPSDIFSIVDADAGKTKAILEHIIDRLLSNDDEKKYSLDYANLKVFQCLQFLNNIDFYIAKKSFKEMNQFSNIITLSDIRKRFVDNEATKIVLNYDNVFINLLPPIFHKEIFFIGENEVENSIEEITENNKNAEQEILLSSLSSGESQLLNSLSYAIYHAKNASSLQKEKERIIYQHINLVFDEAELYYHPEYQRNFIYNLVKLINRSNLKNVFSFNITLVTHSPFILSDMPYENILALENGRKSKKVSNTLGANIYDLLQNQFFMKSSIGANTEKIINEILLDFNKLQANTTIITQEEKKEIKTKYRGLSNFYKSFSKKLADNYLEGAISNILDIINDFEIGKVNEKN